MRDMRHTCLFFILLCSGIAGAQLSRFDSSYVLISSGTDDILNGTFYKGTESFPFLSGNGNWQAILVYERGQLLRRNIAVRIVDLNSLGPEVMITNDTLMNRNASIAHTKRASTIRKAITLFETHQQGSVRIRYSYFDGSGWTPALHMPADTGQSHSPSVTNLGTDTSSSFLAVYAARGAIFLRRFDNGSWGRQFKVSPFDSTFSCLNPAIISNDYFGSSVGRAHVAFNYDSSGTVRIFYITLTSYGPDSLVINSSQRLIQSGNQLISGFSRDYNFYPVLNYDYKDQLVRRFFSASVKPPSPPTMFQQEDLPGDDYAGSGTGLSIITSDLWGYIAGCWLNTNSDSTFACCKHTYFSTAMHRINSVADEKKIAVSPLLPSSVQWRPKIMIVWNDVVNSKYVIKASHELFDLGKVSTDGTIPASFALHQNFPNPFNPVTNIRYDLPNDNFVTIRVYDMLGKELLTLVNEYKKAGRYSVRFNGTNLPSGIYIYSVRVNSEKAIKAGVFEYARRMMLLK